jgi:hypothetical protein
MRRFGGPLTAELVRQSRGRAKSPEQRKSLAERFWEKVSRGAEDECWLWTGAGARTSRYGNLIRPDGQHAQAHRVAWELAHGPVPDGLQVLHTCDHGLCVNPAHLFLGTQLDNVLDMERKGRHGRGYQLAPGCRQGECNGNAKLTEKQVRLAKQLAARGMRPCDIQERTGIKKNTLFHILSGRQWTHVEP